VCHSGDRIYRAAKLTQKGEINRAEQLKLADLSPLMASVVSNVTCLKLIIDPSSIVYPEESINNCLSKTHQEKNPYLAKMVERLDLLPSLFYKCNRSWTFSNGDVKQLPTLGLTIDRSIADLTFNWFKSKNITIIKVSENDPSISTETTIGYIVFLILESSVTKELKQLLINERGEPLFANFNDLLSSPYHQKLAQIQQVQSLL